MMAACVAACKKMKARQESAKQSAISRSTSDSVTQTSAIADLEDVATYGDAESDKDENDFTFEVRGSVCNVKIDNTGSCLQL